MGDVAIRVEGLGKHYSLRRSGERSAPYRTLREELMALPRVLSRWRDRSRAEVFWALREVSFDVRRGEVLGIIGRNGAGKSTLLKILSRIVEPSAGAVDIFGRVGSLLEVGTGFHPELTGRENIYLSGAILGMRRHEVKARLDEIVEFAGVEKFIDTPCKHFSSGMYARLGFAVASHLEADILLLDEVLAVGDVEFQKRCLGKMSDVARGGRTVLFVSHDMGAISRLATRCILLQSGRVGFSGPTSEAVAAYSAAFSNGGETICDATHANRTELEERGARFLSFRFPRPTALFGAEESLSFVARIAKAPLVPQLRVSLTVYAADGGPVGSAFGEEFSCAGLGDEFEVEVTMDHPRLAPGKYHCAIAVGTGDGGTARREFDIVRETLLFEVAYSAGEQNTISSWPLAWGRVRFKTLLTRILP